VVIWVRLMGLKMCVGMSYMRCHFKITTCFGHEKSWEPPKCISAVFSGIAPIMCWCSRTRVFQLDAREFSPLLIFNGIELSENYQNFDK